MIDYGSIGPDKPYKSGAEQLEKQHGSYEDKAEGAESTPEALPKAPDPSPFKIGPMGG